MAAGQAPDPRGFRAHLTLGRLRGHGYPALHDESGLVGSTLAESLLLGLAGGVVAVPLALAAVRLLVRFGPQELPRLHEVAVDGAVLSFGLMVSLVAGLFFGLLPALRAGAIPASASLSDGARGASAARERHLVRRGHNFFQKP